MQALAGEHEIRAVLSSSAVRARFYDAGAVEAFYAARAYEPYWARLGAAQTLEMVTFLEQSWTHGLNPYAYHLDDLRGLLRSGDSAYAANLDLLLTDAYVRIGRDLTGIRVNPKGMGTDRLFWRQPLSAQALLSGLARSGSLTSLLGSLEPRGETYKRLRAELKRVVFEPAPDYERVLPLRFQRAVLKPSQRHERVIDLRMRLGVSGRGGDPYFYDDELAAAVISFQRANNLKPDGIVGAQTLEILNLTRAQKINQILANLERLRWVEEDRPRKFVVVNIPSKTLWAVEDGRVAFQMPVIVGRKKRPTNSFIAEIHGVRFNPDWTVPPTIKKEDILPALRADPEYLSNKGMELMLGHGQDAVTIDPASVDWAAISEEELKYFRMVQIPGAHNPLGRVRVLMPNRYNIYLHDTNHPDYFERSSRALSSGCVRLKNPLEMADFIMKERSGWGSGMMEGLFAEGKTRDLYIKEPVPVYLLYYTIWVNETGDLVFGSDLYGYDKNLIQMLSKLDGIFIPVDNNGNITGL